MLSAVSVENPRRRKKFEKSYFPHLPKNQSVFYLVFMEIDFSQIASWNRLNARKQAFCLAFVRTGVGAEAARQAGYSGKTAARTAHALLADPLVAGAIRQIRDALFAAETLSLAEARAILSRKARCHIGEVMDPAGNISPELVRKHGQVKSFATEESRFGVNVKAEMPDPISAIGLLARISGWTDRREAAAHDVGGVRITVDLGGGK